MNKSKAAKNVPQNTEEERSEDQNRKVSTLTKKTIENRNGCVLCWSRWILGHTEIMPILKEVALRAVGKQDKENSRRSVISLLTNAEKSLNSIILHTMLSKSDVRLNEVIE